MHKYFKPPKTQLLLLSLILFGILLIISVLVGWFILGKQNINQSKTNISVNETESWKTYTSNIGYSFEIKYPDTWNERDYPYFHFTEGNILATDNFEKGKNQEGGTSGLVISVPVRTTQDTLTYAEERLYKKIGSVQNITSEYTTNGYKFLKLISCSTWNQYHSCQYFYIIKRGDYLFRFLFFRDDKDTSKVLSTFKFTN